MTDNDRAGATGSGARPRSHRPRRLSSGSIAPIVFAVLAAGFGYEALQDRSAMTTIVVASAAIPAGMLLDAADTRLVRVHAMDAAMMPGLLIPSKVAQGWVAAIRVQAGEPLTLSELQKPFTGAPLGQMSIAVPVQQAAGGAITPGDRVDVIASDEGGAYYVAQDLRVIVVAPTSVGSGPLGGALTNYFVVVAVDKRVALQVATAVGAQGGAGAGSEVEIVRSTGETISAQGSYTVRPPGAPGRGVQ